MNKLIKILILDDEDFILSEIKEGLSDYTVDIENNPLKALQKIKQSKYDIFIVDYKMPNMNGIDFLIELKKEYNNDYVSILLTAYSDKTILEQILNKELVSTFIEKPFKIELTASFRPGIIWDQNFS